MAIPGRRPVTASAIVATIQDASFFASRRELAASLGLPPPQRLGRRPLSAGFRRSKATAR